MDQTMVIKLRNNSMYNWECKAGIHEFRIDGFRGARLTVETQPGETYYIRLRMRTGVHSEIPELTLVDREAALTEIQRDRLHKLDKGGIPKTRAKNRLAFNAFAGFGYSEIAMLKTTTSEKVVLSPGTGFGGSIIYGYEVKRYLDIALELGHLECELNPLIDNGDVTFSRTRLSFIPSLIIPIAGGGDMRFKLGAGLDASLQSKMKINLSKIPNGFNDTWSYKGSLGYQACLAFEWNMSPLFALRYGFNWTHVEYTIKDWGNYKPVASELTNLDGSGVGIIVGFSFHF
jgi:hypothetical protein